MLKKEAIRKTKFVIDNSAVNIDIQFDDPAKKKFDLLYKTWAKVNKNGTPDKGFKNNYQIPVVRYGRLRFSNSTGVNEEYQISHFEATEEFGNAFVEYRKVCRVL